MISEDEYLERVVAGIQAVTMADADVRWNEKIEGRQFDVVARFKLGGLRYLVVFEVKNKARKTQAEALDAFVTKARDQKANKMVFVSASGFQTGALAVARRHGVELFTVTFDEENLGLPQQMSGISMRNPESSDHEEEELGLSDPTLSAAVIDVRVTYTTGPAAVLPNQPSQLNYYMLKTRLADGRSLYDVVTEEDIFELQVGEELSKGVRFEAPIHLTPPDNFFLRAGPVVALDWKLVGQMARFITGNVKIDPGIFVTPIVYTDVLNGDVLTFSPDQIPLGLGPVRPGGFYFILNPLNYFYCDRIEGNLVHWIMIESFQAGELVSGAFTQKIEWSPTYIPVTDKAIIKRLQQRLQSYRGSAGRREGIGPSDLAALFNRPRRRR